MNKKLLNNREIACVIIEVFDNLLEQKGVEIPCENEREQTERSLDDNEAKIYGLEYWNLVDDVQSVLDGIHQ